MGIIDSKNRIFDTIVTLEGKRQLGQGNFNIKYVIFSDASSFYQADIISGSDDASNRIYLEAVSLSRDSISFEADDRGRLKPFGKEGDLGILGGKIISGSSGIRTLVTDPEAFASLAGTILSGSFENFSKLRVIATLDQFLDSNNFNISQNSLTFDISDDIPIREEDVQAISIDDIESIFQDKRLSHVPNFMFLPPINKPSPQEPDGSLLGKYMALEQDSYRPKIKTKIKKTKRNSIENAEFHIFQKSLRGKSFETIEFTETSRSNNLFSQFFEIHTKEILKLDVIDFGSFPSTSPSLPDPHVFFVGKVFIDSVGRHTFTSIFTLVFE